MYGMGDPPDYEPRAETSVAAIAAREGRSPDEVAYDYLTADAGRFQSFPVTGYTQDDHEPIRKMLTDPGTLLGPRRRRRACRDDHRCERADLHANPATGNAAPACRSNTWLSA
jgi:N-acyl-D-aspartate/D-glutamate deacylase